MVLENITREGFSEEVTFKEDLKGERRAGRTGFSAGEQ